MILGGCLFATRSGHVITCQWLEIFASAGHHLTITIWTSVFQAPHPLKPVKICRFTLRSLLNTLPLPQSSGPFLETRSLLAFIIRQPHVTLCPIA